MAITDLTAATVHPDAVGDTLSLGSGTPTSEGDAINPGDVLIVNNASDASITVTAAAYRSVEGVTLPSGGGSVPAGGFKAFKFGSAFARPADGTFPGKVLVTYSAQTTVYRALVRS